MPLNRYLPLFLAAGTIFTLGFSSSVIPSAQAATVGSLTTFTAGTQILSSAVNGNFSTIKTAVDDNASQISTLNTSMASAQSTMSSQAGQIGTLANLTTSAKSDLVSAVNEVKSTAVSTDGSGKIPASVIPSSFATLTQLANYGELSTDNTWSGAQSFSSATFSNVKLPLSSSAAVCDASTLGRIYFDTVGLKTMICNGSSWLPVGLQRSTAGAGLNNGQSLTLNFPGTVGAPTITVWKDLGGGNLQMVTGDANFPVVFTGTTVYVTNNSGGTVSLTLVALYP